MRKLIQLFEHQSVREGQLIDGVRISKQHLEALAQYHRQQSSKFFSLTYNGLKFSHYVGVIQVGDLTIEILPKTDAYVGDKKLWQAVLIDMLKACNLLHLETVQSANLRLKSNSILDLYYEKFLTEIEFVLHRGLKKNYRKVEQNKPVCKGQLMLTKQLTHNALRQERMYSRQFQYDEDRLVNQVLLGTLNIMESMVLPSRLQQRIAQAKMAFRKVKKIKVKARHFQIINHNKAVSYYKNALQIAELICGTYSPDIRGGRHHLVAILFDMNLLFEEYVYQKLKRLSNQDLIVKRQVARSFWKRRYIQPDIVVDYKGQRFILDTKWKVLSKANPSMDDLKQVFIYCQYFHAEKSLLIYPQTSKLLSTVAEPYESYGSSDKTYFCQIHFADIILNRKLNPLIGEAIIAQF